MCVLIGIYIWYSTNIILSSALERHVMAESNMYVHTMKICY